MLKRLFFLFPDEQHALSAVNELKSIGVSKNRIQTINIDKKSGAYSRSYSNAKNQTVRPPFRVQSALWNINLLVFGLAVVTFLITLAIGELFWIMAALAMVLVSIFAGKQFNVHIPDVHLSEFEEALKHGGMLLMVDVKARRVEEVESFVHRLHPEAVVGGVNWPMDAFGV